jgi:hypothetical protein
VDPDERPHPKGVAAILKEGHVALHANWEGMALHDNVVFLGVYPSRFTLQSLAANVEGDYFSLYLLVLDQKMRLSFLAGELMRHGRDLHRNLDEARALWNAFVTFRNHYWLPEASARVQGNELYRRFQQGLDVRSLYESVGDHVRDLQEYYEAKAERRTRSLLDFIAFFGLPAAILAPLFGAGLISNTTWPVFLGVAVPAYALFGIGWYVWRRTSRS